LFLSHFVLVGISVVCCAGFCCCCIGLLLWLLLLVGGVEYPSKVTVLVDTNTSIFGEGNLLFLSHFVLAVASYF